MIFAEIFTAGIEMEMETAVLKGWNTKGLQVKDSECSLHVQLTIAYHKTQQTSVMHDLSALTCSNDFSTIKRPYSEMRSTLAGQKSCTFKI